MWKLKAVLCCGSGKRRSQLSGEIQKTESRVKVRLDFVQGIVTGNCSKSSAVPFFPSPLPPFLVRAGVLPLACYVGTVFPFSTPNTP